MHSKRKTANKLPATMLSVLIVLLIVIFGDSSAFQYPQSSSQHQHPLYFGHRNNNIIYSRLCMVKDQDIDVSQQQRKKKKKKTGRRFAQNIRAPLPLEPFSPSASSANANRKKNKFKKNKDQKPSTKIPDNYEYQKMDAQMSNFLKMDSQQWSSKEQDYDKGKGETISVKDLMKQMMEEEGFTPEERDSFNGGKRKRERQPKQMNNFDDDASQRRLNNDFNRREKQSDDFGQKERTRVPTYIENNKSNNNRNSMMRSNMSIEELENTLKNRWGSDDKDWTADKWELEEEDKFEEDASHEDENGGVFFRAKPVKDPFSDDDEQDEFYDEDDEGFEGKSTKTKKMSKLIAPKPVGGKGSYTGENIDSGSSFFGRSFSEETDSVQETDVKNKKKKPKEVKTPELLDENGNVMHLTLNKALYDAGLTSSRSSRDDNAEVDEVADTLTFEDLGIKDDQVLENLERQEIFKPLPCQVQAIPPSLKGDDVVISTHTGSGKTLAFFLPILQLLSESAESDQKKGVKVIILAPGRELASQIMNVVRDMIMYSGRKASLYIGGTHFDRNVENLRKNKPDIVVSTPGRLAELVLGRRDEKSGKLKLGALKYLVLDEFDALLEYKPHREPTAAILEHIQRRPNKIQTFLLSATAKDIRKKVLDQYLRPGYAFAGYTSTNGEEDEENKYVNMSGMSKTVIHGVVHVPHKRFSLETLRKILHTEPYPRQVLIFVENARRVDIVVEKLAQNGIIAAPLHGGTGGTNQYTMTSEEIKNDRTEVNKALREGRVGIVVATELAARGLDAPLLTHVINLDLPTDASHYAHRAGRCGRGAGKPGVVINFTTNIRERDVPTKKFAQELGVTMYNVEPRSSKLVILEDK